MAAKKLSAAQELAKLKRDDAAFSALCASLADESAKAAADMKREVDSLRKGAKRVTVTVTRLRKRLAREQAALKKADNAANRKAVKSTQGELAKARKEKTGNTATLAASRERYTEVKEISARHKKYAAAIATADRAMAKKKPKRKKRAAKRK
ncbi:MAG: hypothetical protein OEN20_06955 [Gammaproteobacteria bacterium]|nr:hypothetical protein [Gammaproteobacteria bacterium]